MAGNNGRQPMWDAFGEAEALRFRVRDLEAEVEALKTEQAHREAVKNLAFGWLAFAFMFCTCTFYFIYTIWGRSH